jgi:hypothetical protein
MERTAAIDSEDNLFVLSNLPPTRAQKRLAFAIVVAMFVTFFIAAGPLSRIQLPHVAAFVPAYTTAIVLSDLGMNAANEDAIAAYPRSIEFALDRDYADLKGATAKPSDQGNLPQGQVGATD